MVSENFYWLSTQPDTLGEPNEASSWYYTPTKQFADFTALNTLPLADVKVSARSQRNGKEELTRVMVENPGTTIAFFIHLKVNQAEKGEEILPVIWQDNYFSLLPGEKREVTATYTAASLRGRKPVVELEGWNLRPNTAPARMRLSGN